MKNKTNITNRFHDSIRTAHVFLEDNQVFIKNETEEPFSGEVAEWFPTDFNWIPARV
ncbi:MAG: hypothetical protein AB8B59_13355 [Maribacter sp.]